MRTQETKYNGTEDNEANGCARKEEKDDEGENG